MKRLILITILISFQRLALAQQSTESQLQTVWGAASNGVCGGIRIVTNSFRENDIYCGMEVGNTTSNCLYIWLPPFEQRYVLELRGSDGRRIRQLKPINIGHSMPWLGQEAFTKNGSLDWFFLKETFDIKTNGQFTLIISERVNAFTNFGAGRVKMKKNPTYFMLPAVTNTFIIPTP